MRRALSICLALLSFALVTWAWRTELLRDAEGIPTADMAPALGGAALLGLAAWGIRRRWGTATGWILLLGSAQLASFQLLVVGREVSLGNVSLSASPGALSPLLPLGLLALQAVAVGAGLWRRRLAAGRLLAFFGPARGAAVLGLGLVSALAFFPDLASWSAKSLFLFGIHLVALANVFLIARAWPDTALEAWRARFDALLGRDAPATAPCDRFALGQALVATVLTAGLAFLAYGRHPHVPDEVVYLLHAQYLSQGQLTLPAPPVPEGFELDLMLLDGERWFCPVPPGWPAVLAIGQALGAPWLVNPILAGIAALVLHLALREVFDRPTARLASLLLCASPWFLFMGMNFMPHTLTLAATGFVLLGIARARRRGRDVAWTLAAGGAVGLVALIRPLEGLIVGLSAGLWSLGALGRPRLRFPAIAALGVGALAVGSLILPYNRALTGDPTKFPIMDYVDKVYGPDRNALGFGDERGLAWGGLDPYPGHHARDVLVNAQFNLTAVDTELFGWACGALMPLALLLMRRRRSPGERGLAILAALVVGAHSFYWFSGGPDFGARYWYLILPACLAVFARGLLEPRPAARSLGGDRLLATAAAVSLVAVSAFVPWRIFDRYLNYRGMRPDVRELVAHADLGRSLVLVRGRRHPDYASAAVYNGCDLERDGPVFAWDRSPEVRARLLRHYRDRDVFVLDGPTRTGGGYRLVAGPLKADDPRLGPPAGAGESDRSRAESEERP